MSSSAPKWTNSQATKVNRSFQLSPAFKGNPFFEGGSIHYLDAYLANLKSHVSSLDKAMREVDREIYRPMLALTADGTSTESDVAALNDGHDIDSACVADYHQHCACPKTCQCECHVIQDTSAAIGEHGGSSAQASVSN